MKYPNTFNTFPLRICSFNVNMNNTFTKKKNINTIINYFFKDHNEYKMDVMCLQEINNIDIHRDIIKCFERKVIELNNWLPDNNKINLYYYPYSSRDSNSFTDNSSTNNETWSLTEKSSDNKSSYSKLIVSRHKSIIYIEDNQNVKSPRKLKSLNKSLRIGKIIDNHKNNKFQVINININNIIISIYNVDMFEYSIFNNIDYCNGFKKIERFININKQEVINYCNINQDIKYRDIHVLCGQFNINEVKNNVINKTYKKLIKNLNCVDIFRYVTGMRGRNSLKNKYDTNILFSRNNYVLLSTDIKEKLDDVNILSKKLYDEYGLVIIDTFINNYIKDIFINFPTEVIMLLKKDWDCKINRITRKNMIYKSVSFHGNIIQDNQYNNEIILNDILKNKINTCNKDDISDKNNILDKDDTLGKKDTVKINNVKTRNIKTENIKTENNDCSNNSDDSNYSNCSETNYISKLGELFFWYNDESQ
jgi:hypothetical protein